jgi:hypothetical protein
MVHSQIAQGAGGIAVKGQHQPLALIIGESHAMAQNILTGKILGRLAGLDSHFALCLCGHFSGSSGLGVNQTNQPRIYLYCLAMSTSAMSCK